MYLPDWMCLASVRRLVCWLIVSTNWVSVTAQPGGLDCDTDIVAQFGDVWFSQIQIQDHLAFCTTIPASRELRIYDIVDVSNARLLSSLEIDIRGFAVQGIYIYAMVYDGGLQIIDVSDPTDPHVVGSSAPNIPTGSVWVSGDTAVIINGSGHLYFFDVSDPTLPRLRLFTYGSEHFALSAAFIDQFVYVAYRNKPVSIYDIGTGWLPTKIGEFGDPSRFRSLIAKSGRLYMVDSTIEESVLEVWSIIDPLHPTFIEEYEPGGRIGPIAVDGDRLALGIRYFGIEYLIAEKSSNLVSVNRTDSIEPIPGMSFVDGYLVSGTVNGIAVLDSTKQSTFPIINQFEFGDRDLDFVDTSRVGDVLLSLSQEQDRLGVIFTSLTDPLAPAMVGHFEMTYQPLEIVSSNQRAIVRGNERLLWLLNIEDPSAPSLIDRYVCDESVGFAIDEHYFAFAEVHTENLLIYDLTSGIPSQVYQFESMGYSLSAMRADSSMLYLAFSDPEELHVMNMSSPDSPVLESVLNGVGKVDRIYAKNNYLYAVSREAVIIIDVRNPKQPSIAATIEFPGVVNDIAVGDSKLVAGTKNGFFVVYDIGNPNHPRLIHSRYYPALWATYPEFNRIELSDDESTAYVSRFFELLFIDLTTSCMPTCPPDTNHDGILSPADFTAWIAALNAQAPECDQNNDGSCTPADFTAWVANYNAGC